MSSHRTARRHLAFTISAAALAATVIAGCSGDDESSEPADTTVAEETTTTEAADRDETSTTATGSTDVETTELLDYLNDEDPDLGGLFDWNTGTGVIAVNYIGTQTVQLYAAEIDEATALDACELAAGYVFEIDEEATIEVLVGTYPDGEVLVRATGPEATCAVA